VTGDELTNQKIEFDVDLRQVVSSRRSGLFGFIVGLWSSHYCFRKVTSPYSIQFRVMKTMSVEKGKLGPQICDMKPTGVRRLVLYDGFHLDPMTLE
jgi:hypothetical protein